MTNRTFQTFPWPGGCELTLCEAGVTRATFDLPPNPETPAEAIGCAWIADRPLPPWVVAVPQTGPDQPCTAPGTALPPPFAGIDCGTPGRSYVIHKRTPEDGGGCLLHMLEDGTQCGSIIFPDVLGGGSPLEAAAVAGAAWIARTYAPAPDEVARAIERERQRCIRVCQEQSESALRVRDKVTDAGVKSTLLYGAIVADTCANVIASGSGS